LHHKRSHKHAQTCAHWLSHTNAHSYAQGHHKRSHKHAHTRHTCTLTDAHYCTHMHWHTRVHAQVKSTLGSAPWSSSVMCAAYADLAVKSGAIEETALWVREAFKVWPQVKEVGHADAWLVCTWSSNLHTVCQNCIYVRRI